MNVDTEWTTFYAGIDRGEIELGWCTTCETHVWPPGSHCLECLTPVADIRAYPGEGIVHSYSVVHRAPPGFDGAIPYVLGYVTIRGGPTVLCHIVADGADDVNIGAQVRLASVPDGTNSGRVVFRLDE